MQTTRTAILAAAAALTVVPVAAATPAGTKAATEARQAAFKSFGRSMKTISDEVRKPSPDMALIAAEAAKLEKAGPRIPRWFPRGSGPESGLKTEALPAIWAKPAEFRGAAGKFTAAAKGLRAAAAAKDAARVRAALGATGGTCKACHEGFRLDK